MRTRGDLKCGVVLTPGTGAVWADEDWFCLSGLSDFLRNHLDQSPVWTIAAEEEEEDEEEEVGNLVGIVGQSIVLNSVVCYYLFLYVLNYYFNNNKNAF